jgi:hypothetical protein
MIVAGNNNLYAHSWCRGSLKLDILVETLATDKSMYTPEEYI